MSMVGSNLTEHQSKIALAILVKYGMRPTEALAALTMLDMTLTSDSLRAVSILIAAASE